MLEPELSATLRTWTRLLRAHVATAHVLGGQLQGAHGLSINDYETLSVLSRAPGRRMKRVDLARRLLLTPSGVTRLLDGLQDASLVERTSSDTDLRVVRRSRTAGHQVSGASNCREPRYRDAPSLLKRRQPPREAGPETASNLERRLR